MGPDSFQKVIGYHTAVTESFVFSSEYWSFRFLNGTIFFFYHFFFASFYLVLRSFGRSLGGSLVHPDLRNLVPERSANPLTSFV
jgi:hypothetical protein